MVAEGASQYLSGESLRQKDRTDEQLLERRFLTGTEGASQHLSGESLRLMTEGAVNRALFCWPAPFYLVI